MPDIPSVGVKSSAFNKMVGSYVPNRVFTGASFTATGFASWEIAPGSVATNVAVKPLAVALGCAAPAGGTAVTPENCIAATNETPIKIRTAAAHGLATGDRVTIAGVPGNTAANGTFTVTVPATTTPPESPATTVFTLDGTRRQRRLHRRRLRRAVPAEHAELLGARVCAPTSRASAASRTRPTASRACG